MPGFDARPDEADRSSPRASDDAPADDPAAVPVDDEDGSGGFEPLEPQPPAMRRLTRAQYQNSVEDIFGAGVTLQVALEPDEETELFLSIGASKVATSAQGVEQYMDAALSIAQQVFAARADVAGLADCAPETSADPCVAAFLERYGRRLLRRSLTADELERYLAVVRAAGEEPRFVALGMQYALATLLQSPEFLYVWAVGEPDPETGARRYTSLEMAGRLSYVIWNSTPDEALLEAAEAGLLDDPEQIETQVRRMLAAPRARSLATRFFSEAWRVNRLADNGKDPDAFPDWSPQLAASYRQEFDRVLTDITATRDADLREIFRGRRTFVDSALAKLYGLPDPGDGWTQVSLPDERSGLFTSGAVLAANAPSGRTSPTARGVFVLEHVLCDEVPPPPPDVDTDAITQPDPDDFRSNRERLAEHRKNPVCAGCHAAFDPIGLALERFDAIGRYREQEHGATIDASGEVGGETIDGGREVAQWLAAQPDAMHCTVENLQAFAGGHRVARGERGVVDALSQGFAQDGYRWNELWVRLTTGRGFRLLAAEEP